MSRHFHGVPEAAVIATAPLVRAKNAIEWLAEHQAMGAFYGEAGTGKTFAVELVCGELAPELEIVKLDIPVRATPRYVIVALLQALTGVPHEGERFRLISDLRDVLAERDRLIVLDEAQNLGHDAIETLRHVHDDPETRFALALTGGNNCFDVLQRYPMLRSRVPRWVPFAPMDEQTVLEVLPGYHRLYATTKPQVLLEIDARFARGNWRDWAAFTLDALELCAERGATPIDSALMEEVFRRRSGGRNG